MEEKRKFGRREDGNMAWKMWVMEMEECERNKSRKGRFERNLELRCIGGFREKEGEFRERKC